jgi:hypothetical protein
MSMMGLSVIGISPVAPVRHRLAVSADQLPLVR